MGLMSSLSNVCNISHQPILFYLFDYLVSFLKLYMEVKGILSKCLKTFSTFCDRLVLILTSSIEGLKSLI